MFKKLMIFISVTGLVAASQVAMASVMATPSHSSSRHDALTTADTNAPQYPTKYKTVPKTVQNTAPRHTALTTTQTNTAAPAASAPTAPPSTSAALPAPSFNRRVPTQHPTTLAASENAGMGYYFSSDDFHPYVGTSVAYEYFQTPKVGMGSQDTNGIQSKTRYESNLNRLVVIPTLYAGYHFDNDFLPMLFGEHANLKFNFSWFNAGENDNTSGERSGAAWSIDGSGSAVSTRLRDYKGSVGMVYRDLSLYFVGDHTTSNPHLVMNPYFGLNYTYFQQNYNTSMEYSGSNEPDADFFLDKINENIATHYYGLGFGNNLVLKMTRHFQSMLDLGVQVLYADSNLKARQNITTQNRPFLNPIRVKDNNDKLTYRARASLGLGYAFTTSDASPVLSLSAGIDRWGYVAEVKNPRGTAETKKARIIDSAEYNPLVMLDIRVPLEL